jgi:non-ribosomal peptide synthetase component F
MQLAPRLPGLSAAMLTELDAVLAGDPFHHAADLSVLLHYLVDRTLAGDDERLTPYTIAVEIADVQGVDTAFSGAPQRHIDRLGTALARHYARDEPVDGLCLTLIEGSFRVWIVRPEVAYPSIFRRPKMVEWPLVPKARRISAEIVGI